MEEETSMSPKSNCDYICCVCGDAATNYRFYGASSVCYSCRIFFRRVVSSNQSFDCNGSGTKMCSFGKFTRNHCKKCRFEKCLSVGLLPYLVNSNNRNQNRNKKSLQKKQISSDKEIQVFRSENQNPTPTIQILLSAASILDDTHKLRPKDLFDNGLILGKVGQVFEEVYFNEYEDENLALYCQLVESIDSSCIQQLRQNEPLIRIPPNTVEISATVLTYFAKTFLSQFFPQSDSSLIEALADNISTTIIGLYISCDGCMRCDNLLDQWEKEFFIIHTEKIKSYYNQTYPDMTTLGPLHLERLDLAKSPYAKCQSDEDFVERTRQKLCQLVSADEHFTKLIYLLAIFSPVNMQLPERENTQFKDFQQKISIMTYSHLMGRNSSDNLSSTHRMASVVSMIEDFNKVGRIFRDGLINCQSEGAVELDCIEIESFA